MVVAKRYMAKIPIDRRVPSELLAIRSVFCSDSYSVRAYRVNVIPHASIGPRLCSAKRPLTACHYASEQRRACSECLVSRMLPVSSSIRQPPSICGSQDRPTRCGI